MKSKDIMFDTTANKDYISKIELVQHGSLILCYYHDHLQDSTR